MKSTIIKTIFIVGITAFFTISVFLARETKPFKIESLLDDDSRLKDDYLTHQENFNDENLISIAIVSEKVAFSEKEIFTLGSKLTKEVLEIRGVSKVDFVTNAEYLNYSHRSIKLRPFFETGHITPEGRVSLKNNFFKDKYISEDHRVLLGAILLSKKLEGRSETLAIENLLKLAPKIEDEFDGLKVHFIGHKVAKHYYLVEMLNNQKFISPIIFLILSLLVLLLFKSFIIVFWVDLIIAISYCFVLMLINLFDGGLGPYSALSLTFVIIVSTSDLIHFFSSFSGYRGRLEERLRATKKKLWLPCLLTTLTTAISFLTLFFNDMAPVRRFGLYCSFGSLCAFILTFYFLPWVMRIFPRNYPVVLKGHKWLGERLLPKIRVRCKGIGLFTLALCVFLFGLSMRVDIDDDFYDKFSRDHPLAKSFKFYSEELKAVSTIDLVYPNLVFPLKSNQIEQVVELESQLRDIHGITQVDSFLDILSYLEESSNELKGDSIEKVGTLEFLKNIGALANYFGSKNSGLKTTIYLKHSSIKEVKQTVERVEALDQDGLIIDIRGFIKVRSFLYGKIISNFIVSFALSFISIFLVFLIIFRSLKWATLALIPNIFPIIFISALMGLLDIKVEGNAIMLICVIMGIAVDDTIHFLHSVKQSMRRGLSQYSALEHAYEETSKALIGTTMVFIVSFPCFLLSDLTLMVQMGSFIILALTMALLADFIILPAILFYFGEDYFQ